MLQLQNTVAVNFAGNPALAVPVPLRGAKVSRDEPAIDRAATGRGGSAQRGAAGRRRCKKVTAGLFRNAFRREIGVGKIHVLVDARAIEFRDAVLSRAVHGEIGWNRMVFFIASDASDIDAADELARG